MKKLTLISVTLALLVTFTGCTGIARDTLPEVDSMMEEVEISFVRMDEQAIEVTEKEDSSETEETKDHRHLFPIVKTFEPDCTNEGYYLEVCLICGLEKQVPIPAVGHTLKMEIQVEPTETQEGLLRTFCSVCGESLGMDMIPELIVPTYGNEDISIPIYIAPDPQENTSSATMEESTVNSNADTEVYVVSTETISLFDGAVSWITTWYSDGSYYTEYVWTDQADGLFTPEAHEHHYDSLVVEPTCMDTGYTKHWCSCGDSYITDETPIVDHKMKIWSGARISEGTIVIDDEGNLINDTPGWEITSEYRCEYGCGWTVLTEADYDWKEWGWLAVYNEDIFHQYDEEGNRIIIGDEWTDIPENDRALIWVDSYGEACDIPGFVPAGWYRGFFGNTTTPFSYDDLGTPRNYGMIDLTSGNWFAARYGNDPDPHTLILHSRQTTSFYAE